MVFTRPVDKGAGLSVATSVSAALSTDSKRRRSRDPVPGGG